MFVDPSNDPELDRLRHEANHPTATGERMSAPARELAQRLSGGDEVLLLWYPASERWSCPSATWQRARAFNSRLHQAMRSTPSTTPMPTQPGTKTVTAQISPR